MIVKSMEFDILLKYFTFWQLFNQKSLVLCPKMVLPLEKMVLAAFYIIIPGYYRIHGNECPFSYKFIYKLALFSTLLFKWTFYS